LFDRITQAIKRHERDNKSTVVILLDLNKSATKPSIDLLKAVANRLKEITRGHDSIARFGLYEFIIVLEGITNPEDAYIVSDKIEKSFSTPFLVEQQSHQLGCNIGIAMHPMHCANDVLLLNYADAAMQYAKLNDKSNIQVFNDKILEDYNESQHLNSQLQRAIDLKELSVQFQPIMDLRQSQVAIAVAHIRWHHAAYNNAQTFEFINAAKNGKLREPLHLWLLEHALAQATQWPNHDLGNIKCQVKLVKEQLMKPGLANTVKALLNVFHFAPTRLIFEIETTALNGLGEIAQHEIDQIKALGVSFNINAFDDNAPQQRAKDLSIDTITSTKQSLSDGTQSTNHVDISEQIIGTIEANSIYPPRQQWRKNACTIAINNTANNLVANESDNTYLVCDSVVNEKLITLAHLLKSKATTSNTST